jgi:SOS-response transcriptional repressor LexA
LPRQICELPFLTPRQLGTLTWIYVFWAEHRHGPTQREIAAGLGASVNTTTATPFVKALLAKGYLERTGSSWRNIRPTTLAVEKLKLEGLIPPRPDTPT